jgi:ABC-type sugar transport system ATPase subunit
MTGQALATQCGIPERRLGDPVAALSGGNQQKAFVGRCLGRDDVSALLLDEPTRGVDIGGRAAIHRLLRQAADDGLVVVFASTELEELLELGDVIVTMRDGRVVHRHDGDVDGGRLMRDMTQGLE